MGFKTPILLIIWRRPITTIKVIDAIREFCPEKIYVHCDGPRENSENDIYEIEETRNLIEDKIDWPCKITKLYCQKNKGLYEGGSSAISWFFEQVEEGIILEDDTVPNSEFLPYCEELLNRYRNDKRIWCISGNNFQKGKWHGNGSYYFSGQVGVWGWATWRRCWKNFDLEIKSWPDFKNSNLLKSMLEDPIERKYWSRMWEKTYNNPRHYNTWDLQWVYCCLINSGLTIVPNRNLVRNIGYGKDATHTLIEKKSTLNNKFLGELKHPDFIIRNKYADRFQFDYLHEGREKRSIFFYILNIPKRIYILFIARWLIFQRNKKSNFKLKL